MSLQGVNCDPVSIILVTAGSRGQKVLFRYPNQTNKTKEISQNSGKVARSCSRLSLRCDTSKYKENVMLKLFNIVFVLKVSTSGVENSVINCSHDLSKRIAIALKHEEYRCCYLTSQREKMLTVHDEISSLPEDSAESPFHHMLPKSTLARDLKNAFESLCESGVVQLMVNGWVNVSFCLPHKVHNLNEGMLRVPPKAIEASLAAMRPYHTLLFLVDEGLLLASLPGDCSPALTRLVRRASPLKSDGGDYDDGGDNSDGGDYDDGGDNGDGGGIDGGLIIVMVVVLVVVIIVMVVTMMMMVVIIVMVVTMMMV
ncbi:hypothetical protein QZH41_011574 [Actinostola sp. cb2023]|nr:hypothetical protein QZH41_011574 [Actinostola sp. cb2023]